MKKGRFQEKVLPPSSRIKKSLNKGRFQEKILPSSSRYKKM